MKNKPKWPRTPEEWQTAVDAAQFYRSIHDCELYGLLKGPKVNAARCDRILNEGRRRGVHPKPLAELVKMFVEPAP